MNKLTTTKIYKQDDGFLIVDHALSDVTTTNKKELNTEEQTIYTMQVAKDCIDLYYDLVNHDVYRTVLGNLNFDAKKGKLVLELQANLPEVDTVETSEEEVKNDNTVQ